jgi:hypothetical protein
MIFRVMTAMKVACDRWVYDLSFGHIFVDNVSGFIRSNRCVHTDEQIKQLFHFVNITEGFGTWDYAAFENKRRECFRGHTNLLFGSIVRDHMIGVDLDIPEDINTKRTKPTLPEIGKKVSGQNNFPKEKKPDGDKEYPEGYDNDDGESDKKILQDKVLQEFFLKVLIRTALIEDYVLTSVENV